MKSRKQDYAAIYLCFSASRGNLWGVQIDTTRITSCSARKESRSWHETKFHASLRRVTITTQCTIATAQCDRQGTIEAITV